MHENLFLTDTMSVLEHYEPWMVNVEKRQSYSEGIMLVPSNYFGNKPLIIPQHHRFFCTKFALITYQIRSISLVLPLLLFYTNLHL